MGRVTTQPPKPQRSRRVEALTWFVAIAVGIVALVLTGSLGATVYGMPVVIALLIGLLQGAGVVLCVRLPWLGMSFGALGVLSVGFAATPDGSAPWPVPAVTLVAICVSLGLVGLRDRWIIGAAGWVVVNGIAMLIGSLGPHSGSVPAGVPIATLIVTASVTLTVLGAAYLVRNIADVRALLATERQVSAAEHARREMVEERARIARELHDVVAHGMSSIQVQAASARYRLPDLDPAVAREFDELAGTARTGMAEMRRLLDVLRDEEARAELAPQPGLRDLAALAHQTGHDGEVRIDVAPNVITAGVSPLVALAAYRIVQESLSNVVRHAPGAAVDVVVRLTDGALRVTVRSGAGGTARTKIERGGHGIRGMRERAALLGGELTAGGMPDGGFIVDALLPLENEGVS